MNGQCSREHLVEGDAAGIEIAAGIDRAVHPAGLFRRHVGERPGDHLGRRGGLALARQTRRDAEAREPDAAGCRVDQDIGRLDVLVDEALPVHLAECGRERDRDAHDARQFEPLSVAPLENPITWGSPPESSRMSIVRPSRRVSSNGRAAHAESSSAATEYSCSSCRRLWGDGCSAVSATARTGSGLPSCRPRYSVELPAFPQSLQHVPRTVCHEASLPATAAGS